MRDLLLLPKAHLHVHLEGAMRPATLAEMAERQGLDVPPTAGYGSFTEFAAMYEAATRVLRTPDDLARVVDEVVEDAALAGAVWVEPSFYAPHYTGRFGDDRDTVEIVLEALAAAAARHGVGAGLMLAADRTADPALAAAQAALAVELRDHGIVAFGLANDETDWPPEPFADTFALTRDAGLLSTPHAGELAGPESVRSALDTLGADRVQHGVRSIEDPDLVKRLADDQVCCDVCPTSNVMLGVAPAVEACALEALLDAGVPCSVNADDPLLFGPGLLDEYELCRSSLGLDDERLASIARFSIEHSGAPVELKLSALTGVDEWLLGA